MTVPDYLRVDIDPTGATDWVGVGLIASALRRWPRRAAFPQSSYATRRLARRIVREHGTYTLSYPSVRRAYVGPADRMIGRIIATLIVLAVLGRRR